MFKSNKNKIIPGSVYALDPENIAKQKLNGINNVIAKKKVGKLNGCAIWEVESIVDPSIDTGSVTLRVSEDKLFPVNSIITRIPTNIPVITIQDLELLTELASKLEDGSIKETEHMTRIRTKALYMKLAFYRELIEDGGNSNG